MKLFLGDQSELFKQIDDSSIDVIITDPPYNLTWKHQIETAFDFELFVDNCFRVLKKDGFLVYFGQEPTMSQWNVSTMKKFKYLSEVIWYKGGQSNPFVYPLRVHEKIMIFTKGNGKLTPARIEWVQEKKELLDYVGKEALLRAISTIKQLMKTSKSIEELNLSIYNSLKLTPASSKNNDSLYAKKGCKNDVRDSLVCLKSKKFTTLWGCKPHNHQGYNTEEFNIKHPTVKPIQIMERVLEMTTQENQIVLDPFMGSGTTGMACKNMNRKFVGFELFEEYYNISKKRIEADNIRESLLFDDI